jgi:hypothetical protein
MTSQSPRIYTYKITFEEVPYYYYGMHEEKVYDENYWGSPVTHKWCWKFYTPKKQILEIFDSREEANKIENRILKYFMNDPYCLNKNCGGVVDLEILKKVGLRNKELKIGICGLTKEQRIEAGKKGGSKGGKISGKNHKENGTGIFSITGEEKLELCRKGGRIIGEIHKKNGTGIVGIPMEERRKNSRKGMKITNSQRWMCTETGYITSPGPLTRYQKARQIDTSKRVRIS